MWLLPIFNCLINSQLVLQCPATVSCRLCTPAMAKEGRKAMNNVMRHDLSCVSFGVSPPLSKQVLSGR